MPVIILLCNDKITKTKNVKSSNLKIANTKIIQLKVATSDNGLSFVTTDTVNLRESKL